MSTFYYPNFHQSCRLCDTSPTVVVAGHEVPKTGLCGPCFFQDREMKEWNDWNQEKVTQAE